MIRDPHDAAERAMRDRTRHDPIQELWVESKRAARWAFFAGFSIGFAAGALFVNLLWFLKP